MTNDELLEKLETEIDGGCTKDWYSMFEEWSEEDPTLTEDQFTLVFDNWFFECSKCSWTLPISDQGEDFGGEFRCTDCEDN